MRWTGGLFAAAMITAMGVASCTNSRNDVNLITTSQTVVGSLKKKPTTPPRPQVLEALAVKALQSQESPLMTMEFESLVVGTILRNIETNGAHKTWNPFGTSQRITVTTKHGMITSTRGFGNDLMSADVDDVLDLVRRGKEGTVQYTQRYLDGNHTIQEVETTCEVTRGYEQNIRFGEINEAAHQMFSSCINENIVFDDLFIVSHDGRILQVRQWVGPVLGFGVLRKLR